MDAETCNGSEWLGVNLDLTQAQMVDSAGLNAIVSIVRRLQAENKRAVIQVKDPHVHRIFLFTRLDRLAEIVRN
jgi:anti-anti-sigma factor